MPGPPLPANKKHQRILILGAAAAGLLLLLYLRSRSSSSGSSTADPAAAAAAAAQNQSQQDAALYGSSTPSTFADNGASAAALGDAVTTGLQGVQNAVTQLQAQQPPAAPAPPGMTSGPAITINNVGQPAGGSGNTVTPSHPAGPPKPPKPPGKPKITPRSRAHTKAIGRRAKSRI